MKQFHYFLNSFLIGSFFISSLISCKKKENPEPEVTETPVVISSVKQSDQSGSSAADGAMDDVNNFINDNINPKMNARMEAYNLPCGVVKLDTTSKNTNGRLIYKLQYGSATPCGYKKKSGTVSFQLIKGTTFIEIGAKYKVTFTDYVVEVLATNDIVKINGNVIVTNVKGGPIWKAITSTDTIQHRIRGNYQITYANNNVRPRATYQLRTWASNASWATLSFKVNGDTLISDTLVSEIGKTYDDNRDFQTQIKEPFIWKYCNDSTSLAKYVLQKGHARMNVVVPAIKAYFDVEAGFYTKTGIPATKVNDCSANAYKISYRIGAATSTEYQLY